MKKIFFIINLILGGLSSSFCQSLDEQVFKSINGTRHYSLNILATSADYSLVLGPLVWSYLLYEGLSQDSDQKLEKALWSAGGVAALVLVNQGIKISVQRERPAFAVAGAKGDYKQSGVTEYIASEKYSFVSQSSSLAFFNAKYFSDEYGYKPLFYSWASLIAWAKIYQGAHYPGDVIAGGLLGYGMAWATQVLHEKYNSSTKNVFLLPLDNGLLIQARF